MGFGWNFDPSRSYYNSHGLGVRCEITVSIRLLDTGVGWCLSWTQLVTKLVSTDSFIIQLQMSGDNSSLSGCICICLFVHVFVCSCVCM